MAMDNIKTIKETSNALYNKLITFNCKASYNGKVLYEGQYDENYNYGKCKKSCVVLEFDLGDKKYLCLEEENPNINIVKETLTDFNDLFNDHKLYNKLLNISYDLPLYCVCEDKSILKKGDAIQKIYENLYI